MSILPIVTYNDPVLRKKTESISELTEEISELINNMIETMYNSDGVGLAAPQIGTSLKLFVVDGDPVLEEDEEKYGVMVFINPEIVEKKGKNIPMDEGCLSIPDIREKVFRPETIVIRYKDEYFEEREQEFSGWMARIIQHEFDHLNGVLFIDYLSSFRKRMVKADLQEIDSGNIEVEYPIVARG
ncbi:MAG: peptide deformylase [Bacteroidetes bacterium]|jgi:peptide deformylase|nr:peptide deformylase [Bacteroidota bacterium]HCI72499.1 peptide deformylase [Balneola sp.]|tara:strand:+ start:232 stop:786 length:555 start_codon:yes stop_codon:yes gene_type:complete